MQKLPNKLVGGEQVRTRSLSQKKGTGRTILISHAVRFNNCLIVEDGTDRLSRNVGTELHSTLRDMSKGRRSHLHRRGGLESRRPVFLLRNSAGICSRPNFYAKTAGAPSKPCAKLCRYHRRTIHVFDRTNNAVLHCLHRCNADHYLIIGLHNYNISRDVLQTAQNMLHRTSHLTSNIVRGCRFGLEHWFPTCAPRIQGRR